MSIKMQNPYEILGVKPTDSITEIKRVYHKYLMLLHPDKRTIGMTESEQTRYLQEIKQAYQRIIAERKESNYPDYNINYNLEDGLKIHGNLDPKNFNPDKFNTAFEKVSEHARKSGVDPFAKGYEQFSSGKNYNQSGTVTAPTYTTSDISVETRHEFIERDTENGQLIAYRPETVDLYGSGLQYEELGLTQVENFSTSTSGKGSIVGSDLQQVYGKNYEFWENAVKKDEKLKKQFNNSDSIQDRFSHVESSREDIYKQPIDQRLVEQENSFMKQLKEQESARIAAQRRQDQYYTDLNMGRLTF